MIRNTRGFTLIELLIVVVIIGILAAIAIPKFAGTKEKAYVAAMKSDLKNLVLAEESYFADENTYGDVAANALTNTAGDVLWAATTGVTVTMSEAATATGYAAEADHAGTAQTCGVFVGTGTSPDASLTNEGEVGCY